MNNPMFIISRLLCQILIRPFLRVTVLPQPPAMVVDKPCLIILGKTYASDELAINTCLKQLQLKHGEVVFLPEAAKGRASDRFVATLRNTFQEKPGLQVVP